MNRDIEFMAKALRLAEQAVFITHPNPPVGCVLVRQGEIVGQAHTQPAGQAHAEAGALAMAGPAAAGATAYVTLEPCSFEGRTPACVGALISAGVARVVVAARDPDPRNAGRGLAMLEAAGVDVDVSVLEDSARKMIRGHIKRHEESLPFVRLKMAMSLDGKTALASGESKWITSAESRADVQKLRARSSAIVTGVQTVIDDDPGLTVRADELGGDLADLAAAVDRPVYILDSSLRVPAAASLVSRPSTVVVTCEAEPPVLPCQTLTLPAVGNRVDLKALLSMLVTREHSDVLFECGATLAGSLITEKLVDELIIYIAPRLMGQSARSLLNLPEIARMTDLVDLNIRDIRQLGNDIRITAGLA